VTVALPVIFLHTTLIYFVLLLMQSSSDLRCRMVIIHPVWLAQAWWPRMRVATEHMELPDASVTLYHAQKGRINANWKMRASVIENR